MDDKPALFMRWKFICVCVKFHLEKPLNEGIWIGSPREDFFQSFLMKISPLCRSCSCLGHNAQNYIKNPTQEDCPPPSTSEAQSALASTLKTNPTQSSSRAYLDIVEAPVFDPWIRVQRCKSKKQNGRFVTGAPSPSLSEGDDAHGSLRAHADLRPISFPNQA